MAFWTVRRGAAHAGTEGSAARTLEPRLEPIQLFTATDRVNGWMIATEERVTDFLNGHPVLRVCVDPATDAWKDVDRADLLVVAPPPLSGPSPRRLHRLKRRVQLTLGPYVVEGLAHLPPGVALSSYLQRTRQSFVALTDAVVADGDGRDAGEWFSTVIVNVDGLGGSTSLIDLA